MVVSGMWPPPDGEPLARASLMANENALVVPAGPVEMRRHFAATDTPGGG